MSQQPEVVEKEPGTARLALSMAFAGMLSGILIIGAYEATLPTITANKAEELRLAVFKVLPNLARMEKMQWSDGKLVVRTEAGADEDTVYAGYDASDKLVGYAIANEGPGFQDTIKLLYGYLPDKRQIVGMEILDSRETPGLGDKIYKDMDFVANFKKLSPDPEIHAVKKGSKAKPNEIDAITGATISSKAVVRIMNQAHQRWGSRL